MNTRTLLKQSPQKKINFDVDGTLIKLIKDKPRKNVVALLKKAQSKGHKVTVWSRNGKEYAHNVGKRLGLKNVSYASKNAKHKKPDINVDDMEHHLGKENIMV